MYLSTWSTVLDPTLLQIRNTPDPDCNISPAEIVFGRPIRDAFSFVNCCSKFSNPSVHPEWHKAWSLKEKAMPCRTTRTCEKLNEHTRQLQPPQVSDHLFIQNQHGAYPSKWDKSGKIIDVKPHNQYLVKINGSGRVTVRNRPKICLHTMCLNNLQEIQVRDTGQ